MLNLFVRYHLVEYLKTLIDFYPIGIERRMGRATTVQAARRRAGWAALSLIYPMGCVAFWLKRRKVGDCRFMIDAVSIERISKCGTLRIAWSDVQAVWMLSQVYLIDKGSGAMPIPYRCIDSDERVLFESYAALRLVRVE